MAILVTGGAGFIGSHLIERLVAREPSVPIVCLDDFNDFYDPARKRANVAPLAANPRVTIVEGSFCDAPAMRRLLAEHQVRQIVHLGAHAGVRASLSQAAAFERNNVGGTLALLEAAREQPVERFVLVSSSTVYGEGAAVPFVEDAPLGIPQSPYGVTKRAAELMALAYHRLYGIPVVCVRPFSVYGPRIRPDLAMWIFAESIVSGWPVPLLGDGTQRRDFTHVDDVCRGMLAVLTADHVVGETINLGHHEPVPIRELIALLEQALGQKATIDHRPACSADLPLTCADLTKAARLLAYRPTVELADGVRDFVVWFRKLRDRP